MIGKTQILPAGPDMPDLHDLLHLLQQALGKRGRNLQIYWRPGSAQRQFTLEAFCDAKGDPQWRLYREQGDKRDTVFDYTSCDVLLVHKLIISACGEPRSQRKDEATDLKESKTSTLASLMRSVEKGLEEQARIEKANASAVREATFPVSGDLANLPLSKLLQSARSARVTGRFEVSGAGHIAVVYLQDGVPVDASSSEMVGDEAIIDLLTWKEGLFT